MLYWFTLPTSGVTAITNRLWRGEGQIPRWAWYLFMVVLAVAITGDMSLSGGHWELYLIWLIYFLGYALLPWQAMFSAINGEPPSRKDAWYIQWLQDLTYKILKMNPTTPSAYTPAQWRLFGIVYGTLRACFMIPGILGLVWFSGSAVPLSGLLGLAMGLVYYGGYRLANHFNCPTMAVPLSEMTMGWWHGTYMLICSSVT